MKVIRFFCILFCFFFAFSNFSVSAASYDENLRVGIYYGSGAVNSLSFESDNGFSVGYYENRDFSSVATLSQSKVTVSKLSLSFCVNYGNFSDIDAATTKINELSSVNIKSFLAFYNSTLCVLGEGYANLNDAEWAASNLPISGTAIELAANAIQIVDASKNEIVFIFSDTNTSFGICNSDFDAPESVLEISGSASGTYRGGFEITLQSDGLTAINIIPVESYLYSVVSREMSPSWNIEALKAQAVCARNFALGRINYHKKYGFDVCRTVCCQAYAGTGSENSNVHNAVDQTQGELLLYDGKPIQAVYSSSMGSSTESVENVWGTPYPYLVSVENPYEDTENIYNGKWTKKLSISRATEIMNNRGYNIGTVTDIIALQYTPAGSVLKLKVQGTNGSKTFERESCRSIFSEATYSQKYTVSKGGILSYPTVYIEGSKSSDSKELSSVSILSASGVSSGDKDCYVTDGKQTKQYSPSKSDGDPNTFVFVGEGWGHGVGMSQYGAKGMADAGFDYDEILTHYYTGTYLEKVY